MQATLQALGFAQAPQSVQMAARVPTAAPSRHCSTHAVTAGRRLPGEAPGLPPRLKAVAHLPALITTCCAAGTRGRRARRAFSGAALSSGCSNGARWHAAQWLENSAEQEVGAPVEQCYSMWEDRTLIPQWMPWIRTVEVRPLSRPFAGNSFQVIYTIVCLNTSAEGL